jgi:hypothetical protein
MPGDKKNIVYVHCACNPLDIDFTGDRVHTDVMHLDFQIRACLVERSVCGRGNNAGNRWRVRQDTYV